MNYWNGGAPQIGDRVSYLGWRGMKEGTVTKIRRWSVRTDDGAWNFPSKMTLVTPVHTKDGGRLTVLAGGVWNLTGVVKLIQRGAESDLQLNVAVTIQDDGLG